MFINLDKESFENCKVLKLNCSFRLHDSNESKVFENYLFLHKKGICIGVAPFDTKDDFHKHQLMIGSYTFNALKFRILAFHEYGLDCLLAKNQEKIFKGRFSVESIANAGSYGFCEIKAETARLTQNEYSKQKQQIKDCIQDLENTDAYANLVFQQIEECFKPAEYRQIIAKAAQKYKDNPQQICIEESPKYYI